MQLKALTLTLMAASALVACSAPVAVPTPQVSTDTSVLTPQVDKNVLDRTLRDTWKSMVAMTAGQRLPSGEHPDHPERHGAAPQLLPELV